VLIRRSSLIAALLALGALAESASAITVGMVDTFSTGTNLGWGGSLVTPVADAGPGGTGDFAVQVSGGSRVVVHSQAIPTEDDGPDDLRWTGNFTAAGVKKISL